MVKIHFPELSFREKSYVNSKEILPLLWCERKMIKDTASHFFLLREWIIIHLYGKKSYQFEIARF